MMQKNTLILTVLVTLSIVASSAATFLAYTVWRSSRVAPVNAPPTVGINTAMLNNPIVQPAAPTNEASASTDEIPAINEPLPVNSPAPVNGPPVPPQPGVNVLPPNPAGLRLLEFVPRIGDVTRLYYHAPSDKLFMAVIEPDGMRSIWMLGQDATFDRVLSQNKQPGEIFLGGDKRGNLYAGFENPGFVYRSADGGETWKLCARDLDGMFWEIADDGNGTLWGALHAWNKAILYRSEDDGASWQAWKDFQKIFPADAVTYAPGDDRYRLRHLHGVMYARDQLFVGTGDVARYTLRSDDQGETWTKVWDEGFTAGVVTADGKSILFGPDKLRSHGLVVYDFDTQKVRQVWDPAPYNYSGYTYSVINFNGIYFVAFHVEANEVDSLTSKFGVIASPDTARWYPYFELGPLNHFARTDMYLAQVKDKVYMSLDGALYEFTPLDRWSFDLLKPFKK